MSLPLLAVEGVGARRHVAYYVVGWHDPLGQLAGSGTWGIIIRRPMSIFMALRIVRVSL